MPQKFFNVAGPCHPSKHYMLAPLRYIGKELDVLIAKEQYFAIRAARQSGKTTLIWELADKINAEGKYHALYCSLEAVQEFTEPSIGIPAIVKCIKAAVNGSNMPSGFAENADYEDVTNVLKTSLTAYCKSLEKPLIVFFDEADCLSNGTLITFLRQLRSGFISKSRIPFVHSMALAGTTRPDYATIGSSSPFDIVTESLNLGNFTKEDVAQLYAQHKQETGQTFEPQAEGYIFEQTQGQPWLVNAIARECVEKITKEDYSKAITQDVAEQAIQNLILARGTHFDSLVECLKEQRVRKVIEPMILGDNFVGRASDDFLYTRDLGLIKEHGGKTIVPANPIYAEIMARALSWGVQADLASKKEYEMPKYVKHGKMDVNCLLKDFQVFWRKNSEIFKERYGEHIHNYVEAAPHLALMAFLQRVIDGGGKIRREFAVGSGRVDLCIECQGYGYPMELKIFYDSSSIGESLERFCEYVDSCNCTKGWLVMFDRDAKKSWNEKIYVKEEAKKGKKITIFGC